MNYAIDRRYRSKNFNTAQQWQAWSHVERVVKLGVVHQTMGGFLSDVRTLTEPDGQGPGTSVSAHYLVPPNVGTTGLIFCLVEPYDIAWHAGAKAINQLDGPFRSLWGWGNENTHSIGVELSQPYNRPINPAQLDAAAWLFATLAAEYPALVLDYPHILGHYMIDRRKVDPQLSVPLGTSWDWVKFFGLSQEYAYQRGVNPVPTPVPPVPAPQPVVLPGSVKVPETGYYVQGGFLGLYNKHGVGICGYPLGNERAVQVPELNNIFVTRQLFENVEMEWQAGQEPRFSSVGRRYQDLADKAGVLTR